MKHKSFIFLLVFMLGFAGVGLFLSHGNTGTRSWDISNLKIENRAVVCQSISFEDAVRLEARLSDSIERVSEKKLRDLAYKIAESTHSGVKYYQFVGEFVFPAIDDLQGTLTTLIVAVDQPSPYIHTIAKPMTEVLCAQSHVKWTQMDSAATVNEDKMSARLSAMGYLTVADGDPLHPDRLSNTVFPAYSFSLDEWEGTIS